MKKILLFTLLISVAVFSCRKNHSATNPAAKKYKVTFSVANFLQSQKTFALRRSHNLSSDSVISVNGNLDVLYCIFYNPDPLNYPNKVIEQDSTMSDMGMISDSLSNGTYTVYFIAGGSGLTQNFNTAGITNATFGYGTYNWQDTFYGTASLTVSNGNVTQSVTLHRVVGKLEVQILDNIPSNANSFRVAIYPEVNVEFLNGGMADAIQSPVDTSFASWLIPASAKGKPNFTVDKITSAPSPFTVFISCKDASNNVIASKEVDNVFINQNTKTILSGNLFGNVPSDGTQSFTVKIDTAWNSTPTTQTFGLRRR